MIDLKLEDLKFSTSRAGGVIPIGPPPGLAEDPWKTGPGVVREAVCVPLQAVGPKSELSLRVVLRATRAPGEEVWIEGRPESGNVLGAVSRKVIAPREWAVSGREVRATVSTSIRTSHLVSVRGEHFSWRWVWGFRGRPESNDLGLSEHFLFVTLARPTDPWSDDGTAGERYPPWISALALACDWARDATEPLDAAARVTRRMYSLGRSAHGGVARFKYDGAGRRFIVGNAEPRVFNSLRFISHATDPEPEPRTSISCRELAATVVTFSNLLGAGTGPVILNSKKEAGFRINPTRPLGHQSSAAFPEFEFHVVASAVRTADDRCDDVVFDPALEVDRDEHPSVEPHDFTLPAGFLMGRSSDPPGNGVFLPQLVARDCLDQIDVKPERRCRVSLPSPQDAFDPSTIGRYQRYLAELRAADRREPGVAGHTRFQIAGFTAKVQYARRPGIPRIGLLPVPLESRTLYTQTGLSGAGAMLAAEFWTDEAQEVVISFMAELLAGCDVPPVRLEPYRYIAYSIMANETVFVLLQGAAACVTSVGLLPVDVAAILARPDTHPV
jgi:hypothetical protein